MLNLTIFYINSENSEELEDIQDMDMIIFYSSLLRGIIMSNFASWVYTFQLCFYFLLRETAEKDKISSTDKFILFIGRPSCPYCQLFEPKLSNVARNSNHFTIFHINSENSEELEDIPSLIQ